MNSTILTQLKPFKRYLPFLALVIVLAVLAIWKQFQTPPVHFGSTPVACIGGHENLAQHIHQTLTITVDGVAEIIPANIGIKSSCMAEVHTHDTTGEIHIESAQPGKAFKLGDFFAVWGKPIDRPGYTLEMLVNNAKRINGGDLVLQDEQRIELRYISNG